MSIPFRLRKERTFRRTENVHFSDISIAASNGIDLVEHYGRAVSPPDKDGEKQFYIHFHQTDNNRVIQGFRLFELVFFAWAIPHWFVFLTTETGALEIPPKCFHRSYSGEGGSILLNHAVRDYLYDENTEFEPASPVLETCPPPAYYGITPQETLNFIKTGRIQ